MRGSEILIKDDCKVKVLQVTDGKDPDEFIKKNGREAFLKLIDGALPYIDYKLRYIRRDMDLSSDDGKIDYIKAAAAVLRELSPVEADVYIKKLSKELHIAEGAIKMEILGNNSNSSRNSQPAVPQRNHREEEVQEEMSSLEASIIKSLMVNPGLTEKLLDYSEIMASTPARKVMDILFELYGLNGDFHMNQLTDRLDPVESEALSSALDKIVIAGNEEQVFSECINTWQRKRLLQQEQELITRLSLADEENNPDSINQLTLELMEIQKQINSHGGRK
jgi:DNA primase